jgi:hypothetical protein
VKILNIFNLRQTRGDVGVEIEVEGRFLPDDVEGWRRDEDTSLRGDWESAEYVMYQPVPINKVSDSLKILEDSFIKSEIMDTYRAGTHVHVNVQDLTMQQVINMVVLFLILEDYYIDFCAESRRGNHFCLRSKDAGYLITAIKNMCTLDDLNYLNDEIRYSSINLTSLRKYGSIEFRSLESTTDFDKINLWCQMLYNLKEAAKGYKSPKEIMYAASYGGLEGICQGVLKENFASLVSDPQWQKKCREGLLRAQDIAFSREWKSSNLNIFSKKRGLFNAA